MRRTKPIASSARFAHAVSEDFESKWLPSKGSNLDQGLQRPVCYRYTTRQANPRYAIRTGSGNAPVLTGAPAS